ncbi:hypothetical protein RJ53_01525 [Methanocalculus chunghsingensis]|uniref:DUF86 domain-containing protein n=1 Tax=Methanocalculus chunghsingensis TaxID=156457 RepID=A0A8J7W8S9_9EURY|nr:DUF86 domain-containing protein [Methanocalculus chunghsingensis]MBR1368242.1 hypothetical protein [Methanocalculus chunghsingensis]
MSGAVRETLIRTKLIEMEESVLLVKKHLPESFEEFLDMGLMKDGIYKRIEYAIENIFDICAILNADLKLGIPGEDEDTIIHLVKHGIIRSEMHEKLRTMKGFRNLVVHRYGRMNDEIAFSILQENLRDFGLFKQVIEEYLNTNAK